MNSPDHSPDELPKQPFVEHLIELKTRLIRVLVVLVGVLLCLLYFTNDIYNFVSAPLVQHLPVDKGSSMIVTDITAAFLTPFKLIFFVALFVCMPYLLYQVWAFVAPALYHGEKKLAVPLFISSIVLFYMGAAFAHFVVFPMLFGFFTQIAPDSVTVMPDITSHLNLVIKLFFVFGLTFEIPVATVILMLAGVATPEGLAEKRPYIIVGCFVVGMLLTPPDVLSQTMLAVPMWCLFELGVFCGKLALRQSAPTDTADHSA